MTRAPLIETSTAGEGFVWRDLRQLWAVARRATRNPRAAIAALDAMRAIGEATTVRLVRTTA